MRFVALAMGHNRRRRIVGSHTREALSRAATPPSTILNVVMRGSSNDGKARHPLWTRYTSDPASGDDRLPARAISGPIHRSSARHSCAGNTAAWQVARPPPPVPYRVFVLRPISSEGGDVRFQNNVPDPVTSGKELPIFKFELERSEGRVMGGSYGKGATVAQLRSPRPLPTCRRVRSRASCGSCIGMPPAAEWAFVTEGRVRTTVIDRFLAGDIWYFPRSRGHVIETMGDKPRHFIPVFDNGYFSEFGTFSISDRIGHAPKELLAKNFGLPAATFAAFPKQEVYFAKDQDPARNLVCAAAGKEDAAAHPQVQPVTALERQRRRRIPRDCR
jgi:hypothetical protein